MLGILCVLIHSFCPFVSLAHFSVGYLGLSCEFSSLYVLGIYPLQVISVKICISYIFFFFNFCGIFCHVNFLKSKIKVHVDTEQSTHCKCLGWWILTEWTGLCNYAKSGSEWHRTPCLPSPHPESDPRSKICPHSWLNSSVLPAFELSINGSIQSVLFSDYENNTVI